MNFFHNFLFKKNCTFIYKFIYFIIFHVRFLIQHITINYYIPNYLFPLKPFQSLLVIKLPVGNISTILIPKLMIIIQTLYKIHISLINK